MTKALIFDFDGVLVESSDIKTAAFRKLFADYPDKVNEIVEYHKNNMGISRYVKFRHIYEKILHKPLTLSQEKGLGDKFSQLVLTEVIKAPFVKGAIEFLNDNKDKYLFFIASGTPETELSFIIKQKNIGHLFKGFYGAPATKSDIITKILSGYQLIRQEVVFVGDADSDKTAAKQTGINFIARVNQDSQQDFSDCKWQIADFLTLRETIAGIEK